jgi:hypothetical protein
MRYALLSDAELRLLDVLLERGVFRDPPASIIRMDIATTASGDPRAFPHLRQRIPAVMAISRPVGGVLAQGSIAELLHLLARSPLRDPTAD